MIDTVGGRFSHTAWQPLASSAALAEKLAPTSDSLFFPLLSAFVVRYRR
jgi:hypothetical protein